MTDSQVETLPAEKVAKELTRVANLLSKYKYQYCDMLDRYGDVSDRMHSWACRFDLIVDTRDDAYKIWLKNEGYTAQYGRHTSGDCVA